ncbi:MAG: hypothetical protein RI922_1555 [Bacteroidota bacterium]|jgi:hypothetical protein
MKKLILFAGLAIATLSCNKVKTGDVTFWQATGSGTGITVVSLDGISSNITSEYTSTPSCGSAGCAVFNDLEEGTYSYSASDGTNNWAGTVTVIEGCNRVELY